MVLAALVMLAAEYGGYRLLNSSTSTAKHIAQTVESPLKPIELKIILAGWSDNI